jgi:hypothetical protein
MKEFELINETGSELGGYLKCNKCGARVERGFANISRHWVDCSGKKLSDCQHKWRVPLLYNPKSNFNPTECIKCNALIMNVQDVMMNNYLCDYEKQEKLKRR